MSASHPCETPEVAPVANRPGLSSIAYRVADHAGFVEAMQLALRRQPPLRELNTSIDDPSIALIDAWAVTLDVLSFYQERIANEHYLRTATERESVLRLARQIGYELRPGVAASTFLAFTVETTSATGAPNTAEIKVGTQAQSVPGQDELPQVFETVEEIHAEAAWNELRARTTVPYTPQKDDDIIYLKGVATNLAPGDGLLLIGDEREKWSGSERWDFRHVKTIATDNEFAVTTIRLDRKLGSDDPFMRPAQHPRVYAMRSKASHFGYNAPDWNVIPDETRVHYYRGNVVPPEWPGLTIAGIAGRSGRDTLFLDRLHKQFVPDSWIVVVKPTYEEVYRVTAVAEDALAAFGLSGKSTKLTIEGEHLAYFNAHVRDLVVYGQSELLEQAERPLNGAADVVAGSTITLQAPVVGLSAGRLLAVSGTTTNGEQAVEIVELKHSDEASGVLTLASALEHVYVPKTVRINANVARATHGETRSEKLGSGRAGMPFQSFTLANAPLTHVSAANPSGHESTLVLRVDGIEWLEVPSLYGQAAEATTFEARQSDDGKTTVRFGDGRMGARLPTGNDNVTAEYRVGSGLDGHVAARQIKLLTKKPLGVKSVENPHAPSGADERETLADARDNAPLTVLTLDRVVSLSDVESFARAFPGIAKARVARLWDGEKRFVHVTVAGVDGGEVALTSATYEHLRDGLLGAYHGAEQIRIASYKPITFTVGATLTIDESRVTEGVLAAAKTALLERFSFDSRSLGQGVTSGEVMAVLQGVDGVVAVDLDLLDGRDALLNPRILARSARYAGNRVVPAQLVTIDPDGIVVEVMAS